MDAVKNHRKGSKNLEGVLKKAKNIDDNEV